MDGSNPCPTLVRASWYKTLATCCAALINWLLSLGLLLSISAFEPVNKNKRCCRPVVGHHSPSRRAAQTTGVTTQPKPISHHRVQITDDRCTWNSNSSVGGRRKRLFLTSFSMASEEATPETKAKAYITLIYRHKPHTAAAAAILCHRQSGRTALLAAAGKARVHELWPATKQPYATLVCPFEVFHPRNPCNYMEYYSLNDPRWTQGWVGLVGWPTKWSHVNHRSGIGQGKSASQRPTT